MTHSNCCPEHGCELAADDCPVVAGEATSDGCECCELEALERFGEWAERIEELGDTLHYSVMDRLRGAAGGSARGRMTKQDFEALQDHGIECFGQLYTHTEDELFASLGGPRCRRIAKSLSDDGYPGFRPPMKRLQFELPPVLRPFLVYESRSYVSAATGEAAPIRAELVELKKNGMVLKLIHETAGGKLFEISLEDFSLRAWKTTEIRPVFLCCGGNDETPPDHTMDCSERK